MGTGALFSLSGPEVETEQGKLPGISTVGMIEGRTWRRLLWPGEEPKPDGEVRAKLIVWSLRNVKVPGTVGGTASTGFDGGSGSGRRADRSG